MNTPLDIFLFFFAVSILFFFPGWSVLKLTFRNTILFSPFETLVFSFGIGVGFIDFLMIILGKLHIPFTIFSILFGLFVGLGVIFAISEIFFMKRIHMNVQHEETYKLAFTQLQSILFLVLFILTLFIKVIYLSHTIVPSSTDLGHHMYWSKLIAVTGTLPSYAKQNILTLDNTYTLSNPLPIPDFIIGEHLPFSAIHILTSLDFLSAFPILFLFLINILSLITIVFLALRIGTSIHHPLFSKQTFTPQNIALMTLLFFGPLYTLSSPEAKFVSGGVVGNIIGNFFIPLIFLALFRSLKEKKSSLLTLSFFFIFTLAYTHHLSTLMMLFEIATFIVLYSIIHFNERKTLFTLWRTLIFSKAPILFFLSAVIFFFMIAMPTYIETHAIGTALGTPTKTTRTGLSFLQMNNSLGSARTAFGISGLLLFIFLRKYKRYSEVIILGWISILLIMTLHPDWLFINIPSNRIVTYLSFPLGIFAALAFTAFLSTISHSKMKLRLPNAFVLLLLFSFSLFVLSDGLSDNNNTLLPKSKSSLIVQTFSASSYLAKNSTKSDIILKDHNYITADAWIKLFFLRDYSYPLSRGFFKRYEDNPYREQCTRLMISLPNTENGKKCYTDLGVRFVMINPHLDTAQFEKSHNFSRIYASDDIHIYAHKQ